MKPSKDPILAKDYRADYRSRLLRKESYEKAFKRRRQLYGRGAEQWSVKATRTMMYAMMAQFSAAKPWARWKTMFGTVKWSHAN